jgi:hypothetical protein
MVRNTAADDDVDNVIVMIIITWLLCSTQEGQAYTNLLLEYLGTKYDAPPLSEWANYSAADPNT